MTARMPGNRWIAVLPLLLPLQHPAAAATADAAAVVEILQPISVLTQQSLDFGGILAPSTGTQTFELDVSSAQILAGNGDGNAAGEALLATFAISGAANRSLNVSALVTQNFADPAVSLSDLKVGGSASFDTSGQALVTVGGKLTVAAAAAQGVHGDAVITVTVNYE